ncbi:hypothetical protein HDV57DRAFT_481052, partial [Trichoderma longibrachiatum]
MILIDLGACRMVVCSLGVGIVIYLTVDLRSVKSLLTLTLEFALCFLHLIVFSIYEWEGNII